MPMKEIQYYQVECAKFKTIEAFNKFIADNNVQFKDITKIDTIGLSNDYSIFLYWAKAHYN